MTRLRHIMAILAVYSGVLAAATSSSADEQKWETSLSLGLSMARGNSTNLTTHAEIKAERKAGANELKLGARLAYGETGGARSEENGAAGAQYNRLLSDRTYLYAKGEVARDEVAKLDYRLLVGPGAGHYLIKNDKLDLSLELGGSYLSEKTDETDDAFTLRIVAQCNWRPGEKTRIWESIEYLPEIDEFDSYLINYEFGIEAAINSRLSVRLTMQDRYDSTPAAGTEENDVSLVSALVFQL